MNEKYQKFLTTDFTVFDIETSGLDPMSDNILEIAAVKMRGPELTDRLELLAQPTKAVPPEAEKIHGLNEIYLFANGQPIDGVIKKFLDFIGDSIVVGHNIRTFDWLFILYYAQRLKLPAPENKLIDTLELSRKLLTLPNNTLASVARHFGYEHREAHRAMPDVEVSARVFIKLMEKLLDKEK